MFIISLVQLNHPKKIPTALCVVCSMFQAVWIYYFMGPFLMMKTNSYYLHGRNSQE